jgi:Cytochrome c554 and c-prime
MIGARARSCVAAVLACSTIIACRAAPRGRPAPQASASANVSAEVAPGVVAADGAHAVLPRDEGPYFPSLARTAGDTPANVALLADAKACGECHKEAAREWQASAHAHASFDNPWYRASVDELRTDLNNVSSRHCAGCHDPLLLFSGGMDRPVAENDRLATGGVTCLVCHGAVQATSDGNASYTLDTSPVPIPNGDADSLARHRARVAGKTLRSPLLCASCHRGFLGKQTGIGHHLSGMDEAGAWKGSPWAGSRANFLDETTPQVCTDCHMRPERAEASDPVAHAGTIRSHRFAGGHSALARLLGDSEQLAAIDAQLDSAIRLDVPVLWVDGKWAKSSDALALTSGTRLDFDVVIRNTGVGHNFPAGVKDIQDTWVELELSDQRGRVLARAGNGQERAEDPSAYALRAQVIDADGHPETHHSVTHFGSAAFDHTIPPLAARVIRYSWRVPPGFSGTLDLHVRVRHRRHRQDERDFACQATLSTRGQSFAAAARTFGRPALDGCAAEPVHDIADYRAKVAAPEAKNALPLWQRLYDHALGLSVNLQERLAEANQSLQVALSSLGAERPETRRPRAMLLMLEGRVFGRQGRLADALSCADRAQALVGQQPAIDRVRAAAYEQVWRWTDAANAYQVVTAGAPGDTSAWRDLAKACVAARRMPEALAAAHSGLALQPRDEGLLRSQALALEALGSPEAPAARAAFLKYRDADEASAARIACDRQVPTCARDRVPVSTIELVPVR